MIKHKNNVIILLFSLFIAGFFFANLFLPDNSFSPKENRNLQTLPRFSTRSLFRGSFTRDFEDYCADQFAGRDQWIALKARLELAQGKGENNGVFLCEGERLIEPFSAPSAEELERRIGIVNALEEASSAPVTLSLIPTASEIYGDLLPAGAANDSQEKVTEEVSSRFNGKTADLLSVLRENRDNDVFYRTDHHWTSRGAFLASQILGNALGYSTSEERGVSPETVSEDFFGTTYSSSGFFWVAPDRMETLLPEPADLIVERYDSTEPARSTLYHPEMLATKDKYRFFLGGNSPRVVLSTGKEDLPSLLILRDSYADSLVPFLTGHFSSIHLLDLRYYRESVLDYIRTQNIDQVLVLYSVSNFCTDSNLMLMTQ